MKQNETIAQVTETAAEIVDATIELADEVSTPKRSTQKRAKLADTGKPKQTKPKAETPKVELDEFGRPVKPLGSVDSIVYVIDEFNGMERAGDDVFSKLVRNSVTFLKGVGGDTSVRTKAIKTLLDDAVQQYISTTKGIKVDPKHLCPDTGRCTAPTARDPEDKSQYRYLPSSFISARSSIQTAVKLGVPLTDNLDHPVKKSKLERANKVARLAEKEGLTTEEAEAEMRKEPAPRDPKDRAAGHFNNLLKALKDMPSTSDAKALASQYSELLVKEFSSI